MTRWNYKLKLAGNGYLIFDADGHNLCDVFMTNRPDVAKDRARLISAVPDLLEAARNLLPHIDDHDSPETDFQRRVVELKAAVEKAEGVQS